MVSNKYKSWCVMGFYDEISKYYDIIFPVGQEQVDFIMKSAGRPPKNILDIACGTGGYSIALALNGYEMYSADIDTEMINVTRSKALSKNISIKTYLSDMLNINKVVSRRFDCVFCIGNSIVHLKNLNDISSAINKIKYTLNNNGVLLLQIINFERVLSKNITSLPSIIDDEKGIEFTRAYKYNHQSGLINFNTNLNIKHENKEYSNSIELFPLLSSDLMSILETEEFSKIEFFSSFNSNDYIKDESFMLVAKATL